MLSIVACGYAMLPGGLFAQDATEAENRISQSSWKKATKSLGYSENYKDLKPKKKKERRSKQRKKSEVSLPGIPIPVFKILSYIFLIAIVAMLLYFILKNIIIGENPSLKKTDLKSKFHNLDDNIHDVDLDQLLKKVLKEKEFNMAVRIYYLKVIKLLSNKSLIKWRREKTNRVYILEMSKNRWGKHFQYLSQLYNQVWFGMYTVTEAQYILIEKEFDKMIKGISDEK